jgi:hypothetical protein
MLDVKRVDRKHSLAQGQSVEKFSPEYEALCNYGVINEEAA